MRRLILTAVMLIGLAVPTWAGFDEGIAAYLRGDYATAAQEFEKLAEEGHAGAKFNLGVMYYNGEGTPPNYAEAMKWYRRAAEQDHIDAQYNLGFMYANGEGVPPDYAEAAKWYRRNVVAQSATPRVRYALRKEF